MREKGNWHRFFFVADFISSDQILNEMNFNGRVGPGPRLSEKHLSKTEVVKYFLGGKDR